MSRASRTSLGFGVFKKKKKKDGIECMLGFAVCMCLLEAMGGVASWVVSFRWAGRFILLVVNMAVSLETLRSTTPLE
jgi:hypothetical protein